MLFKKDGDSGSKTQFRVSISESDGGFSRKAYDRLFKIVESYDQEKEFTLERRGHAGNDELTRGGVNEAIGAVRSWDSELALVPYFNTISGLHEATARELVKGDLIIVAEVKMKIDHALVTSRRAFRKVIEEKVGRNDPDVQKFLDDNVLGEDAAKRLSSVFVNWMIDLYGHPKSFEQCEASLAGEGLPRRDHHRLQGDPVRMVLRVTELLGSVGSRAGSNWGGGDEGGNTQILVPLIAQKGKELEVEDLYTTATRGLLPIPSPFMAAIAPKGSFPRLDEKLTAGLLERDYGFTPDHLAREMIELTPPSLPTLDPAGNATRFLLIAHANNKDIVKKALKLKKKLWACTDETSCSVFENTATKKIAFAAQLADKGKWSKFHELVRDSAATLSLDSRKPTLLPPEILEHPGGKSIIMEGIYPYSAKRQSNPEGIIKSLDQSGVSIAKSINASGKAVPAATFLGAYVSFDELKDEHQAASSGSGSTTKVRWWALALAALAAVAVSAASVQDATCVTSAQKQSWECQYRAFTRPLYEEVKSQASGFFGQVETWFKTTPVRGTSGKTPDSSLVSNGSASSTSREACAAQPTPQTQTVIKTTSVNCPAECSDKCVVEKGRAPRCLRPPSCPATG